MIILTARHKWRNPSHDATCALKVKQAEPLAKH